MNDVPSPPSSGTFLTTMPGVLTAIAAVVTAVGGLYFGFGGGGSQSDATDDDPPPAITSGPPPTTPVDPDEIQVEQLQQVDTDELGDPIDSAIDDCAAGSVASCLDLLDLLTADCAAGYGASCDALYLLAPVDSDYELFAVTCGARFAEPYAGWCAEL